jgi:hypothetical protein
MVRTIRQDHGRGRRRSRYRQSRPRRIPSLLSQSHPHRRHRHRIADPDRGSRSSRGRFLSLSVLEELNRPLVLLRGASGLERTEVPPPATIGVDLSRVEAVLARFQLTNHAYLLSITAGRLDQVSGIIARYLPPADCSGGSSARRTVIVRPHGGPNASMQCGADFSSLPQQNSPVPTRNSVCPPISRFERDLKAMHRQRVLSAGQSRTCSLRPDRRTRALSGGAAVATLHLRPNPAV